MFSFFSEMKSLYFFEGWKFDFTLQEKSVVFKVLYQNCPCDFLSICNRFRIIIENVKKCNKNGSISFEVTHFLATSMKKMLLSKCSIEMALAIFRFIWALLSYK